MRSSIKIKGRETDLRQQKVISEYKKHFILAKGEFKTLV